MKKHLIEAGKIALGGKEAAIAKVKDEAVTLATDTAKTFAKKYLIIIPSVTAFVGFIVGFAIGALV